MNFELIAPPSHIEPAQKIATLLGKELIVPQINRFADGELEIRFTDPERLKNKKIYIIQATNPPVHDNLMQLLLLAYEAKNAGAQQLFGIIPYFGYARHDKGVISGTQGAVGLIAQLLEYAGFSSVITVELHSKMVESYFEIPVLNVSLVDRIAEHIKSQFKTQDTICLVAPDHGAQERVLAIAQKLSCGSILFSKERYGKDATKIVATKSMCDGTIGIIIDDMIDTGGTAINACNALLEQGFSQVYGYFVHPVFSADAQHKIEKSRFTKIFVSNTISMRELKDKIEVFDIENEIVLALRALL